MSQERVSVTVPESKLKEWDEAVATSNEYATRSQLVRRAVSNEIRGSDEPDAGSVDVDIDETAIHSAVDPIRKSVRRELDEFGDELRALRKSVDTSPSHTFDPKAVLMEIITDPDVEGGVKGLTAGQIAERFGGDASEIRELLTELAAGNPMVHQQEEQIQYKDGIREITVYWCDRPDRGTGADR